MEDAGIRELRLLADLDEISARYQKATGAAPINLSLWNPSPSLTRDLELSLPASPDLRGIDYVFSYGLAERPALLHKLGFDPNVSGCLITHSGSGAIVSVCNWLNGRGCSRVLVIGPRYFTVPYALSSFGLEWNISHVKRVGSGKFVLPDIEKLLRAHLIDAVWLTNPVYCTSIDIEQGDLDEFIKPLLEHGVHVVIDECLSEEGRRAGPRFNHERFVAICAPHKSVCVNGIKFAAVVFANSEQNHFDTWCDVWAGCLPISSVHGVRHYLDNDFHRYAEQFKKIISDRQCQVASAISGLTGVELDRQAKGYLVSVYAPKIGAYQGLSLSFLEDATAASGAIFIPGTRNEMDPDAGLSFRLNLAAMDIAAVGALKRLCCWLSQKT